MTTPTISRTTAQSLTKIYKEINSYNEDLNDLSKSASDIDCSVLYNIQQVMFAFEAAILPSLNDYVNSTIVGAWSLKQKGLTPVTASRLIQHINIDHVRGPEDIWSYAGLNPKKVHTRNYSTSFKEVCVEIGRSFVKHSDQPDCFYGELYNQDKTRRINLNKQGVYADLAADALNDSSNFKLKNWNEIKSVYEAGLLPQERIEAQAQRYAVKIFLAHWHAVAYREKYGVDYKTIHKNIIEVPEWPFN